MDDDKKILKILAEQKKQLDRIERLLENQYDDTSSEKVYAKHKPETIKSKSIKIQSNTYKGIVGGIQFLMDSNYLNQLRSMREIFEELKREGYYYSLQSVDTTLRRIFVSKKKVLTRTQVGKVWKYAIRK